MSIDSTWSNGFWVKEEGLGHEKRENQADRQREEEGGKELEDAITRTDPRKVKDKEERECIGGKQPGSKEDPKGDTEVKRSNGGYTDERRDLGTADLLTTPSKVRGTNLKEEKKEL
ncbi:hypothetical protein NDU88_003956 [Pleurodeles waltl]|uniref:Uncharacterized protein n=1 Tax=Pleurodeles waltl TaxID=8319 RepID=A0AAV7M6X5_PLEWA|nr:hypothetical protein NDU88_003956 [Pleurodeles waltl]